MAQSNKQLAQPEWRKNPQGEPRRLGVELEMSGLTLDRLAEVAALQQGLAVTQSSRYERKLTGDPDGDWGVELDFDLLKKMGRETRGGDSLSDELGDSVEDLLKWFSEPLVPLELVSPPLPLERLPEVEILIDKLREAGAKGTSDKLVYAFGMQLNPEIPSTETDLLVACLKAFFCLYDWLVDRAQVDISRQITSYVDPFPPDYVEQVLDPTYWPGQAAFIDDYLAANPTRNRALDLLPLFKYLDAERLARVTQDPLIKARPAFHYRLPNCEIDRPDWGLYLSWNDWVTLEQLAADRERLNACCRDYLAFRSRLLEPWLGGWRVRLESQWLAR